MSNLERQPHKPELYIGGVEAPGKEGVWIGTTLWLTQEEIMKYCEEEVEELHEWDMCMRMAICIEEYEKWWSNVRRNL